MVVELRHVVEILACQWVVAEGNGPRNLPVGRSPPQRVQQCCLSRTLGEDGRSLRESSEGPKRA